MKTFFKISTFALLAGFFASPAFAIDQVKLTSGQVIEGTVLNDVTNLYVDIRLVNGDTKRIPHSEVSSVDRDVPSRKDRDIAGNQSLGFVGVNLGGAYQTDNVPNNNVAFDYGIKAGVVTGQMGDTKVGFAISYDSSSRTTSSPFLNATTINAHNAFNDINLQMLFMRIANSGFYFGPNVGVAIRTGSADVNGSDLPEADSSTTGFEAGASIGYDVYLSDSFSIGPEVRYEHIFGADYMNTIKFTLGGTIHF